MEIETRTPPIVKCKTCGRYFLDADFSGICPACEPVEGWRRKPKTCRVCGKEFLPVRKQQVYCSRACKQQEYVKKKHAEAAERQKEPRECPYCHKVFTASSPQQKYCNPKCAKRMNSLAFRDKTPPKIKPVTNQVRILSTEQISHGPAPRARLRIPVDRLPELQRAATRNRKNYMTDKEREAAIRDLEQKRTADW